MRFYHIFTLFCIFLFFAGGNSNIWPCCCVLFFSSPPCQNSGHPCNPKVLSFPTSGHIYIHIFIYILSSILNNYIYIYKLRQRRLHLGNTQTGERPWFVGAGAGSDDDENPTPHHSRYFFSLFSVFPFYHPIPFFHVEIHPSPMCIRKPRPPRSRRFLRFHDSDATNSSYPGLHPFVRSTLQIEPPLHCRFHVQTAQECSGFRRF